MDLKQLYFLSKEINILEKYNLPHTFFTEPHKILSEETCLNEIIRILITNEFQFISDSSDLCEFIEHKNGKHMHDQYKNVQLSEKRIVNAPFIKHNIDGKTIYSNFRNVGTILISRGQNVTSGSPLGRFGSNPIEFYLDDGSKNLDTGDFIGKTFGKTKTDGNSGSNRRSSGSYSDSEDSKLRGRKDYGAFKLTQGLSPFHQVWADTLAIPLTMATGAVSNIFPKKENFESQKKLIEEIERIKTLLK